MMVMVVDKGGEGGLQKVHALVGRDYIHSSLVAFPFPLFPFPASRFPPLFPPPRIHNLPNQFSPLRPTNQTTDTLHPVLKKEGKEKARPKKTPRGAKSLDPPHNRPIRALTSWGKMAHSSVLVKKEAGCVQRVRSRRLVIQG